jgi:hypothetical protein
MDCGSYRLVPLSPRHRHQDLFRRIGLIKMSKGLTGRSYLEGLLRLWRPLSLLDKLGVKLEWEDSSSLGWRTKEGILLQVGHPLPYTNIYVRGRPLETHKSLVFGRPLSLNLNLI